MLDRSSPTPGGSLHCLGVSSPDGVSIEEVTEVTDDLVKAWAHLMPQLSSSAPPPGREWLEELIASDSVLFVARSEGEIVGALTLVLSRIPVGLKAWIEDVVVDENQRGKRIGDLLSRAAVQRAQKAGARNINLESRPSRVAAHRLYKRVGFAERETTVYRYVEPNS
jgi:ribosomal protein S18 acetylase RimI-like enzyme